jgi:hypothetical protein
MKNRAIALAVTAFLIVTGWCVFRQRHLSSRIAAAEQSSALPGRPVALPAGSRQQSNRSRAGAGPSAQNPAAAVISKAAAPATSPLVEPTFESTNLGPATILENMRTRIRQYNAAFGGNPVGTNPEITQALQGDNPKHLNFLKPDGNRVNDRGELVDPWNTPYFFHQLSGTEMEIRSAGPDCIMYTSDDLLIQ